MLVFPQTFNYRLIIGTLVIVIAVLGSYSISNYNSFNNQEAYLEQEANLVENELTEMISLYNDVSIENEAVKKQLEASKTKMKTILASMQETKASLSLISKYRNQIYSLKKEREVIFAEIDSLVRDNKILNVKVDSVSKVFHSQKKQLAALTYKNKNLLKVVEKASVLHAKNITVSALVTNTSFRVYETDKLAETDHLEICANLESNALTPSGNKNIYVQILDTNDSIVSERGVLKYEGKHIKYSGKTTIKNISGSIKTCLKIGISNKEKLKPGAYSVQVFQNATLLGNASIHLN